MDNQQIATVLEEIGQLLEIDGANHFRVLAYKNAAENLRGLGRELKDMFLENPDQLGELPGIGADLEAKIVEMLTTGSCDYHAQLLKKYGRGLLEILHVRSVGPKKAALFYHQLGVDNLEKLKAAALAGQLSGLPRMGKKSEDEILRAIEEHAKYSSRMLLSEALPLAEQIIAHMSLLLGKKQTAKTPLAKIQYAGSLRRCKETVGDLDILTAPFNIADAPVILQHFQKFPTIKNIVANGPTKCSVILDNGVQADLRVVELKSFGAALHYFTGSKDHNVSIRTIAIEANKKINEYGIFDLVRDKKDNITEQFIIGDSEENLYQAVGLSYIEPVLRENRGEFQASIDSALPALVQLSDLRGDLNINTSYSTGKNTLAEICQTYAQAGYNYLAINDDYFSSEMHSHFNQEKLTEQIEEIAKLQKKFPTLRIFKSVKIPINNDGSIDLPPDHLLDQLDFLTVKIAHSFNLPEPTQTARVLKAFAAHPKVKMLSCPNARLINQREVIAINIEKIIIEATAKHLILEINSQPNRLDLLDFQIKLAGQKGCLMAINSDLRTLDQLEFLQYGLWTAQRGWAEQKHIINTQSSDKLVKLLAMA